MLKHGLIRRIGDGNSTRIWSDNWIPRDYNLRPLSSLSADPPVLVSEFICLGSRTWDVEALNQHLLPMDTNSVMQIPISHTAQSDFWEWHYEKSGVFSVRPAYRMIVEMKYRRTNWLEGRSEASNVEELEGQWKKLWQVQVPSKLRIFAWRLGRSSLSTGAERLRRQMATLATCSICNATADTWRHSLLDCNMAKAVWSLAEDDLVVPLLGDETDDPKLWLLSLCKSMSQDRFIQVLVTLWAIWWARRKVIHEDIYQSSLSIHLFITRYIIELDASRTGQPTPRPAVSSA